ncbi:hypothetical protein EXN66_Car013469 [Channa argus]|uniref:Uncharacterized protein n=1 Tax=Channa argus TaxID=215402 RepID=A0A6G1Q6A2_CHAAH|nr:hypothetical protein EXN66_Car013469 [Channa argus]
MSVDSIQKEYPCIINPCASPVCKLQKQLWEFPGKVEWTQGDSQEFYVSDTQLFPDNNCFAPV